MPAAVRIDPTKLIEAAFDFAEHQSGGGRPRSVWLRRAVSSAYYALFHHMAIGATQHLLSSRTRSEQLLLTRSFGHGAARDVCRWVARGSRAPVHAQQLVAGLRDTSIADVADALVDLQEQRHAADYDHFTPFLKESVLVAIRDAETAIRNLDAAPSSEREAFFSLLSLKTRLH